MWYNGCQSRLCPACYLQAGLDWGAGQLPHRVSYDLLLGLTPRPLFYFLRAHHPLTRNRHAPSFAEYITSYGLHPPNDHRQAESVCAGGAARYGSSLRI